MREQSRNAAPVYASTGSQEVVARAPRDAAEFELALARRFLSVGGSARERESRITLDALARGEEHVALLLAHPRIAASFDEQVLYLAQRVHGRALDEFHPPLRVRARSVRVAFDADCATTREQHARSRERPCERGRRRLQEPPRRASVFSVVFEESRDAEGRCGREVDDCEFVQKHGDTRKGNAHASLDQTFVV